jgi:hypothetical protein
LKIIILTPIKNEDWILNEFLIATSVFADHIIILDQNSTDDSLNILKKFKKVIVIENTNQKFNEAERQHILIEKARELYPQDKVLIALDADEIISADCINSHEWNIIKTATKGTVLKFFKPNLYLNPKQYIEPQGSYWPLGFVDDFTTPHQPNLIHSTRIPTTKNSPTLILKEIKFLHLAYLRPNAQRAKLRFYSVTEKELKNNPWYLRRRRYCLKKDFLSLDNLQQTPNKWLNYENLNIHISNIKDSTIQWHDKEVLLKILKNPFWYFWLDDIWYMNWNDIKKHFKIQSNKKIIPPPRLLQTLLKFFDQTINNK